MNGVPARSHVAVFLLDDHPVVRRGVRDLIETQPDLRVVGEAATAEDAVAGILRIRPDVAVLDAHLPAGSGIDVCRAVRSALPSTYCLILTSFDDDDAVLAAVLAGASGYVLKDVRENALVESVRTAALGRSLVAPELVARVVERARSGAVRDPLGLTARERAVLDLIADGLTNRQIAEALHLAEKTVKNYVSGLLAKLGLERRTQAAALACELRWRTPTA